MYLRIGWSFNQITKYGGNFKLSNETFKNDDDVCDLKSGNSKDGGIIMFHTKDSLV